MCSALGMGSALNDARRDWNRFSDWLDKFRTSEQWNLDQILMEYYKTNPEIRWFEDNEYNTE